MYIFLINVHFKWTIFYSTFYFVLQEMYVSFVGTRKHQKIPIGIFKCQIRVFQGDLSIVQGFYEV